MKPEKKETVTQKVIVFQQQQSGEKKIRGIEKYGESEFIIETRSIDDALPEVIDDASQYFPDPIETDLVLDFLTHPDLSHDLALICSRRNIPVIASGKKVQVPGVYTPPT